MNIQPTFTDPLRPSDPASRPIERRSRNGSLRTIGTGALLLTAAVAWAPALGAEPEEAGLMSAILEFFGLADSDVPADGGQDGAYPQNEAAIAEMFRLGQELILEINGLREALAAFDIPVEPEPIAGRGPPHLAVKALEVMAKIGRVQQRLGLDGIPVQPWPNGPVTDQTVLLTLDRLVSALRELRSQMEIEVRVEPLPPVEGDKTYSMVYKQLGDASFLLDGLSGEGLTSRDVFGNLAKAASLMSMVATTVDAELTSDLPSVPEQKSAAEVERQLNLAIEKAVGLQSQLGLIASTVPALSVLRVGASENHDAANILLAELLRIALHLNINTEASASEHQAPLAVSPTEVYALALLTNANLDRLGESLR